MDCLKTLMHSYAVPFKQYKISIHQRRFIKYKMLRIPASFSRLLNAFMVSMSGPVFKSLYDHVGAPAGRVNNLRCGCMQVSNAAAATTAMLLTVSFYVIATTLPATVVYVLEESFPQGAVHLSDAEIVVDDCWQRFFRYLTVRRITEEVRV